jgi:demethylmenaquinone methyltransferase/2-methoxy-6-polyprenyl-1,4-benzoquinol methylase
MFDKISQRYDLTNDVLTCGIDRLWRISTVRAVRPGPGQNILDLAAGTGTSSVPFSRKGAHVTAADFSEGMLEIARKRHAGNPNLSFVWADATNLQFDDNSFDAATISFGLRNVQDVPAALKEMTRVVKPGGCVVVCEFSRPIAPLRLPYFAYLRYVLPQIANAIGGAKETYQYLNESIEQWPDQNALARLMQAAGLVDVKYRNLSAGIAALHRGYVPEEPGAGASARSAPRARHLAENTSGAAGKEHAA